MWFGPGMPFRVYDQPVLHSHGLGDCFAAVNEREHAHGVILQREYDGAEPFEEFLPALKLDMQAARVSVTPSGSRSKREPSSRAASAGLSSAVTFTRRARVRGFRRRGRLRVAPAGGVRS